MKEKSKNYKTKYSGKEKDEYYENMMDEIVENEYKNSKKKLKKSERWH